MTRSLYSVVAAQHISEVDKWFWIILVTIGVLAMMFWSGYVPYMVTPPSQHKILTAQEADQILEPDDVILGLAYGDEVKAYLS